MAELEELEEKCWRPAGKDWSWWTTIKVGRRPTLDEFTPLKALSSWAEARFDAIDPHVTARVEIISVGGVKDGRGNREGTQGR